MAVRTGRQTLFSATTDATSSRDARGGKTMVEALVSPESFRLAAGRRVIERTIMRRDGSSHTTLVSLDKTVRKRSLAEPELASLADAAFLRSAVWPSAHSAGPTARLVDLFSGCGLMTLGVWEACRALGRRLEPVLAADMNAAAADVYKRNFPRTHVSTASVEELLDGHLGRRPSGGERALAKAIGTIDILVGGPPCQGHSDLNNHTRRADPKNKLYERMARFAELVSPTHVIVENVSAVLHDRGRIVDKTVSALIRLGYHVDQTVAEVSTLGVAQRRRRHVLVASRDRHPDLKRTLALYERGERAVAWAIGDLRNMDGRTPFDTASVASQVNQKRIDYLFKADRHNLPDGMRPDCHRFKEHSYKSVYGRMYWDQPAQTITSGFTSMGQGRFVHPKAKRTITPHEAARLQFIPDFFRFGGPLRTALTEMIGNAVPTKLTYVLALELLR